MRQLLVSNYNKSWILKCSAVTKEKITSLWKVSYTFAGSPDFVCFCCCCWLVGLFCFLRIFYSNTVLLYPKVMVKQYSNLFHYWSRSLVCKRDDPPLLSSRTHVYDTNIAQEESKSTIVMNSVMQVITQLAWQDNYCQKIWGICK